MRIMFIKKTKMIFIIGLQFILTFFLFEKSTAANLPGNNFKISTTNITNHKTQPNLAYNSKDNQYFIVWADTTSRTIWGKILNGATPDVTNSSPFRIDTGGNALNPAVAYNPDANNYFVIWETFGYNGPQMITGRAFNANGTAADLTASTYWKGWNSQVVYTKGQNKFLIVCSYFNNVRGFWVNANNRSGASTPFTIGTSKINIHKSAVAYGDSGYFFIVWDAKWDFKNSEYSGILGNWVHSQSNLGVNQYQITWFDGQWMGAYNPSVAYDSKTKKFLVIWEDTRAFPTVTTNYAIFGQFVNLASTQKYYKNNFLVTTASSTLNKQRPEICFDSVNGLFLATWDQTDIMGQWITPGGLYQSPFIISNASNQQTNSKNVFNSKNQEFLTIWKDQRQAPSEIYGQRISSENSATAIHVVTPNGGEKWEAGTFQEIKWNSFNFTGNVRISVNYGGQYGVVIVQNTLNDGSYKWKVTNNPSTTCLITITSANGNYPSDTSDNFFEITTAKLPNAPSNLNAIPKNANEIDLTWLDNSLNEDLFSVERKTGANGSWSEITTTGPNINSYSDQSLAPETDYYYRVRAKGLAGYSSYSNEAHAKTFAQSYTPTGTNVVVDPSNDVKLTFDNVTSSGNTTVTLKSTGTPPSSGFQIIPTASPTYYNIQTTATFTGKVKICINYDDGNLTVPEKDLKLRVYENPPGQWKDITISVDETNNIICGETTHFSEFAVMFNTGGTTTPQHFSFTSGTGDSYSVIIDSAFFEGAELSAGDEIGVFTPAGLCVGASVWDGNKPLGLTAWADDNQTTPIDGYQQGEQMIFRVWIANMNEDFDGTPTYSQGNGQFGNGAYAELSKLESFMYITQDIHLQKGWSWLSFAPIPDETSVETLTAHLGSLQILINGAGQFYIPNKINLIGQMSYKEGYKIYMGSQDTLQVRGRPPLPTEIVMNPGWNFISYLPGDPLATDVALETIIPNLIIIKNDDGQFFIPNKINTMGNLVPGEGYKTYMSAEDTLIYPLSAVTPKQKSYSLTQSSPKHFSFTSKTGDYYPIIIESIHFKDGHIPNGGDEIGVFTESGLCVGAGVWDGLGNLGIAAWQDDENTPEIDGFRTGEKMVFRYWDNGKNEELNLETTARNGNKNFGDGVFATISLEGLEAQIPTSYQLEQNFPNPFNPETNITFILPEAQKVILKIYNSRGEEVRTLLQQNMSPGVHRISWDGKSQSGMILPSGVYMYQLKAGNFSEIKKALLIK